MGLDEFYKKLETEVMTDYIVRLGYRYDYENSYTVSNEILTFDEDQGYVWLNDWDEGQQFVEVLGYIAVDKIDIRGADNG